MCVIGCLMCCLIVLMIAGDRLSNQEALSLKLELILAISFSVAGLI